MSTVSIVIPSYEQAEYLATAIDSALAQTIRSEVIVVDDGSTDDSYKIALEYPINLVRQVNKGLASARNTGIMNATGDYILFLDADDFLQDNCVEKLLQIAEATKADFVAPSFKTFGLTNELVILTPSPSIEDFKVANRIGYCALFKKSTLLEVGGYSPRMTWGWEDLHMTITMLARNKRLVTTPDVLWGYRIKEKSMIHEANEHADELKAQINKDFPGFYE